ncbi:MAG TPA: type II toxin-antitoxin system RelE/ParE family toxin [Bacteroidetes bacterium]|nr:plasmid stabilization system protein [bacterium BMS3Bbin04]HDO66172.1 type II toxin-antitoxin system RelE/ParE family toxin [Bacteroidota bacterium]HEX05297.1 type II toxin-antitoxin system RelE/ParE family toxin [Bacteroidota bacterium]
MGGITEGSGSEIAFDIVFTPRIEKKLRKIRNPVIYKELDGIFKTLARDPYAGREMTGDLKGLRRIKAARRKYRVVYEIHESAHDVLIVQVAPRKDAYRELRRIWPPKR